MGLPDFLVTGGDVLLVVSLWTRIPRVTGFLISVYATAAKTSLRNHNVSLVAASPTRHPGPLHCSNVQKPTGNQSVLAQKTRFVHISWAAAVSGIPHRRHLWQRVQFHSSVSVSLSHRAAKMKLEITCGVFNARVNRLRLPRAPAQLWIHKFYMILLVSVLRDVCFFLYHITPELKTHKYLTKRFFFLVLPITFTCTAVLCVHV